MEMETYLTSGTAATSHPRMMSQIDTARTAAAMITNPSSFLVKIKGQRKAITKSVVRFVFKKGSDGCKGKTTSDGGLWQSAAILPPPPPARHYCFFKCIDSPNVF